MGNIQEDQRRTRRFNIRFTESEYENLKEFVESNTNLKLSEFIRQSIKEKRERIENPIQHNNVGISKDVMKMIRNMQETQKKMNQRLDNRNIILQGIKERFNHENGVKGGKLDISKETEIIRSFFTTYKKEHQYIKQIPASEIIKSTGLNQKTVLYVLQNSELFETKGKGWVMK
ncbi:hypothetical protein LCGC14_0913420 [marine sediment metagenome]|uniref:Mobilization protein n=1 Tax=marine sediment metagenome TaxID=412755 RepID=A0A0F9RZM4_9ZZZZ